MPFRVPESPEGHPHRPADPTTEESQQDVTVYLNWRISALLLAAVPRPYDCGCR